MPIQANHLFYYENIAFLKHPVIANRTTGAQLVYNEAPMLSPRNVLRTFPERSNPNTFSK
jgi:hypothetical protein